VAVKKYGRRSCHSGNILVRQRGSKVLWPASKALAWGGRVDSRFGLLSRRQEFVHVFSTKGLKRPDSLSLVPVTIASGGARRYVSPAPERV